MDKPVIILGGGLWGCLLAYKLRESLPEVDFLLYEESSTLGRHESWIFRESDCPEAMPWLRPLITKSWPDHRIKSGSQEKPCLHACHLIDSQRLHELLLEKLTSQRIRFNNSLSARLALAESTFVIDTRNICHFKKSGFKQNLAWEIELKAPHHLTAPILQTNEQGIQWILPLSTKRVLIKEETYSLHKVMDFDKRREALNRSILVRGWRVEKVVREESSVMVIPISNPIFRQEGRVINLAGLFHDTTGSYLPHATKLIDRMVKTSFRFGELREVVGQYRREVENDQRFLRFFNRLLTEDKKGQLFGLVHQDPHLLARFSRGQLTFLDRSKIVLGQIGRLEIRQFRLL